jgi:hypothetical protein
VHHDNVVLHRIIAHGDSARAATEQRCGLHWHRLDDRYGLRLRRLACGRVDSQLPPAPVAPMRQANPSMLLSK